MTESDQLMAVGELDGIQTLGWWVCIKCRSIIHSSHVTFEQTHDVCGSPIHPDCPDYLNSLDAIVPVVRKLTFAEWRIFLGFLAQAVTGKETKVIPHLMSMEHFHGCFLATPAQFCEALLRATVKWKE